MTIKITKMKGDFSQAACMLREKIKPQVLLSVVKRLLERVIQGEPVLVNISPEDILSLREYFIWEEIDKIYGETSTALRRKAWNDLEKEQQDDLLCIFEYYGILKQIKQVYPHPEKKKSRKSTKALLIRSCNKENGQV